MVTVLEARDAEGELLGRCDAKCHTAKGSKCTCICEGLNHGKGTEYASPHIKPDLMKRNPDIKYVTRPIQQKLFIQWLDASRP